MIVCWTEKATFAGNEIRVMVSKPVLFYNLFLGLDGTNDPTITIYDSASVTVAGKREIVPTNTYDASALGMNGFASPVAMECREGITVQVALAAGACEVVVVYYDGR